MRKIALTITLVLTGLYGSLHAQLTGMKFIPGDYPTLAAAITNLNAVGVGAGGVQFNLLPGNPQTAPAGGYAITTLTASAGNEILFLGNSNVITASPALTAGALNDAIFKIIGADYVSIVQFTMMENPANTVNAPAASNNMTEWGVAFLRSSTTEGAQHNNVAANIISLNRTYANTWGVYSNVRHSATAIATPADITAATGANSFNGVGGNIISNVNMGVAFIGSGTAAFQDAGNDVGGSSALTGNSITNWGGAPALSGYVSNTGTSYCIYMNHQTAYNVSYNTIVSAAVTPTVTFRGIFQDYTTAAPTGTFTNTISNNTLTLTSGQTSGNFRVIETVGGNTTVTLNITNNTIENCAISGVGSGSTMIGILSAAVANALNITANIIRGNTSTATTGGFTGIQVSAAATVPNMIDISANLIGDDVNAIDAITFSTANSGAVTGIANACGTTACALQIMFNTFYGFTHNVASTGTITCIGNTGATASQNISSNVFHSLVANTTGSVTFISNNVTLPPGGVTSVNFNLIQNGFSKTQPGGTVTCYFTNATPLSPAGTSKFISSNNFSDITVTGATTLVGIAELEGAVAAGPTKDISFNTFSNWTCGSGNVNVIQVNKGGDNTAITNNTISGITCAGGFTGISMGIGNTGATQICLMNTLTGISSTGGNVNLITAGSNSVTTLLISENTIGENSTAGTSTVAAINIVAGNTVRVFQNKIYDLESTNSAGTATGISIGAGTNIFVYNNLIGDLRTPAANALNPLNGININGGTTVYAHYNTIYLNASSTGTDFGSTGIFANTSSTVDLRNNLVVNLSTANGSGLVAAYRRSNATLATYGAGSDGNSFYAGVPSLNHVIFSDGTNTDLTMLSFQARVAPLDAISVTENPTFSSTVGSSPVFLHIPAATPSVLESGGTTAPITTIDFDGDDRPGPVGSVNGGALAPDIGADEFDGIFLACSGTPTAGTASVLPTSSCGASTFTLTLTGASSGPGISYEWQESAVSGGPYTAIVSATSQTFTTPSISSTMYYVCVTTCSSSGMSAMSNEVEALILPDPIVSIAPGAVAICQPGATPVTLTASGADTYSWAPSTGLSATTGTSVDADPLATTTYTVIGTAVNGCTASATVDVTVNATPTVTANALPTTICEGESTTLGASGADTYLWMPGSLSGTLVSDAPLVTTTYTVTGTTLDGCTSAANVTVTVNPAPVIGASATPGLICEGESSSLTASGGISYSWMPGALSGSPVVVAPATSTTYTVTGTDGNGCTATAMATVNVNLAPVVSTSSTPGTICEGESVTLDGSGATTYDWMPGSLSGASVIDSPVATTTYTVTGTDGNGCTATANVTVTVNPAPVVSASATPGTICAGDSVALDGSGATTYSWTPNALSGASVMDAPLGTTTYTMTGTDGNGCTATATVLVTVNSIPLVSASATPSTICTGQSATLNVSGAATYSWMPGSFSGASVIVSPSGSTTYTVTGTDANGCTSNSMATVMVNTTPTVFASAAPITICAGNNTTLNASGANTYLWMPGSFTGTSASDSPLITTTYTVTGTALNGCTGTATVLVTVNPVPAVSASATPSTICEGESVTLDGSGATTYSWMPGSLSGASVADSPLATTTYTVTGTDGNGCTGAANVTVTVNPAITVNASSLPATICEGESSSLSATGAVTYNWMPGSLTGSPVSVNPLTSTTYTVTGTDGNGCTATAMTTVNVNPAPVITCTATATVICTGSNSLLTASGGDTYLWMPGSLTGTSVVVSPASTTTYTVTGTDATGCTSTATVTINVVPLPVVTISGPPSYCQGGSVMIAGTPGGSSQWYLNGVLIPGATSNTYIATAPGIYNMIKTAGSGCSDSAATGHTLIENASPVVGFTAAPSLTICAGTTITLAGTGATSYTWSGGITDNVGFVPVVSSSYTVTGTDGNGCTNTDVASIVVNPLPTVSATAAPASTVCPGTMVTLNGSGAISYTWSGGVTDGVPFAAMTTATYTVTGTDGNGCENTDAITINVNALPTVGSVASPGTTICDGSPVILSGTGAASYSWTGGVFNGVAFTPVATTTYTVTGTDGNGCTNTSTVTVTVNPVPTVSLTSSPATAVCAGESVTLSGSGAVSYTWTGGVTDGVSFTPASTTMYTVTGTDATGCTNTATVTITVNPLPTVSSTANPGTTICNGTPVALSGTGASSYVWTGGVTDGVPFTPASTGSYTVTGTDGNGCSNTASTTITVNPLPTVGTTASPGLAVCTGSPVTLNGTGATSYSWSGGVTDNVPFVPASTTSYVVTGTDVNGCSNTATITITVNPLPTVSSSVSPGSTVCEGSMVTLTGSGANTYAWTGGVTDNVPFAATVTTTYTVTGTDGNGCSNTSTNTVNVNPSPTVGASASPGTTVCNGTNVTLSGTGASIYNWSGGVTDNVPFAATATTTYTVTGTDGSGCVNTATITITVNPLPTVSSTATPGITVCAGTPVTLSGTGATTYSWTGGVTDNVSFTPVSSDSYTVTGTDVNGCTNTSTVSITVNPLPAVTSSAGPATTVCAGASVTLTGFGAATYAWTGGVTDNVPFTASATTTYTVTGTDANGCVNTNTITITVNPLPSVSSVATPGTTVCTGSTVTLNGTGATSYTWTGGVTNNVPFTATATTTYTVTGTDGNGCVNTATTTITVNPLPTVSSTATPGTTVCSGTSVTLNGTGAVSYTWTGGRTNNVPFIATATTTYTVTGTDANGCVNTATTTITVNPLPTVSSTATPGTTVCAGSSVTLNGTGATSYAWSGSVTNNVSFIPASTTTYTVTGTDINGCTNTSTVLVTVNPLPTVGTSVSPAPLVCSGTLVTLNGTGAMSYSWTGGVTDNVPFTAASTTTYTVTGTDANGCVNTAITTVTVTPSPTVGYSASPGISVCTGTVVTLDGTGAVTYAWSGGITDGNPFTPVMTDTYTVVGTDGSGCTDTAVVTITVDTLPVIGSTVSPSSTVCENEMITLNGTGAASYAWSHGVTDNVPFAATVTTTYTVIGTNGVGCSDTITQVVNVIPAPVVTIAGNNNFCTGGSTILTAPNGSSYQWYMNGSPVAGATAISYTATSAGVFNVVVTNASGCSDSSATGVSVVINAVPTVVAAATDTALCAGESVTLTGSGAVAYAWSAGVNNGVGFVPLSTLTYSVTGTDANGCTDTDTLTVFVNALPSVASTATPGYTVCDGSSVTLSGTGAVSYSWTGGITDGLAFTPLATTTFTVTGTDANGCVNTASATVTVNPMPIVDLGVDQTQCGGTVVLDALNPGETFLWSDNTTAQTLTVTASGTYFVDVTTAAGCSVRDTVVITINAQPLVTLGTDDTLCATNTTLDAGNPGATYLWSDNTTNQVLSVSTSGEYFVTATMPGGCTSTDTINIVLNTPPVVALSLVTDTICLNGGTVALAGETPIGGTWTGTGVSGNSFDPMVAGAGTFAIEYMFTDTNGCSGSAIDSVFVDPCLGVEPAVAAFEFKMYPNPNNGEFSLVIGGSDRADVFIYNAAGQLVMTQNANGGEVIPVSLEASGIYMVTVVTADGKQVTQRIVVNR